MVSAMRCTCPTAAPVRVQRVVLIPRGADGSPLPNSVVKVLASAPINVVREENGRATLEGLDSGTPLSFTTSAVGRVRFTIVPTHDKLTVPDLFAQSAAMGADQWIKFSPDDELHTQLAGMTGDKLITTPAGKAGPLLPPSRAADAQALATGVSRVMSRFNPQATTGPAPLSFGFWDDVAGGLESAGNVIAGGMETAVDAAAAAAKQATAVASSLYGTISSQANVAMHAASGYLDTVGAAAQLLVKNADAALPHPIQKFISDAIPFAVQLAIDIGQEVTVIALVGINGAWNLVKTAVSSVEDAAQMAGAFFQRVGLEIKAVIDFLAALFDWDAVLAAQAQIQKALDQHLAGFGDLIKQQRAQLPDQFKALEAKIASLGSDSAHLQSSSLSLPDFSALGGPFAWLMDKLTSYLSFDLSLPSIPGLDSIEHMLSSVVGPVAAEIEAFFAALLTSPLITVLADPNKLLSMGAQGLISLTAPLIADGVKIVAAVADGVLALAPLLVDALRSLLQLRINIPYLTDLIELVVFRHKQQLSLESLLTLAAGAMLHVMSTVIGSISSGPLSFDDSGGDDSDQAWGWQEWLALLLNILAAIGNFAIPLICGMAVDTGYEGSAQKTWNLLLAFYGLIPAVASVPFPVPSTSFLYVEQWYCWTANLIAAILVCIDAWKQKAGDLQNVKPNPLYLGPSAIIGETMFYMGTISDSVAIGKGHGSATLASLDITLQTVAGINNIVPLISAVPEASRLPDVAMLGASAVLATWSGILTTAILSYSLSHPKETLG